MITKDIYDNVVAAMQPAEELGGPEGADYMGLMARIATDAIQRMQTYSSTAMHPKLRALSQGELLAVQGFDKLAAQQGVTVAPPLPPGVTLAPHFGMALRKAFDDGWWLVEHAPLLGDGAIDEENWGTIECAPRVSCYRTEAAADWLIERLTSPLPQDLGEARMWAFVDHADTVDHLERARAELRELARLDVAAAAHDERDVVAPAGNEQRQNEIAARRSAQDDAVAEREQEVEWIVTYAIATYEGSITVRASENADREHIIARAEAALTRKAGPLPLGYRSYQIERSHDGASR